MSKLVSIVGLDRADVLATLYNASKPQGMGVLQYDPRDMTRPEAEEHLKRSHSFDYLKGRVMKIHLPEGAEELDGRLYDRDNGEGAAERAIGALRRAIAGEQGQTAGEAKVGAAPDREKLRRIALASLAALDPLYELGQEARQKGEIGAAVVLGSMWAKCHAGMASTVLIPLGELAGCDHRGLLGEEVYQRETRKLLETLMDSVVSLSQMKREAAEETKVTPAPAAARVGAEVPNDEPDDSDLP